jgi:hypothetical protein
MGSTPMVGETVAYYFDSFWLANFMMKYKYFFH